MPQGRKEVIRVRINNLSLASKALARGVHLILMLLRVYVALVPILVVLVFLVVSWATNQWYVLRRQCQDLVEVQPCLSLLWGMLIDLIEFWCG